MTTDEIKRTFEFILQHRANAAFRMDETGKHLRDLSESTSRQIRERSISTSQRIQELANSTDRQIREFTASTNKFHDDVTGFIKVLAPILEIQSKRLDRLEGHP
jgi:hypothetical protein